MPDQQRQSPTLTFEQFLGVNTATTRAGVDERQAYWLDGFMPMAPRNLRALWGIGSAAYTATGGKTIVCAFFYNIGATPYAVVFLSDGSAVQVNTITNVATTILTAGTIAAPSITSLGVSQWNSQYLLIVANQTNGYWVWDGSVLFGAGGLSPNVTITNVGSGYVSPPTIAVTGGSGSGAVLQATIANGVVNSVKVVNPGSGWLAGQTVTLTFSGGNQAGTGAVLSAVMGSTSGGVGASLSFTWVHIGANVYQLTAVNVLSGGSGYSPPPILTVTFSALPSGVSWVNNAPPSLGAGEVGGVITGVSITPNPSNVSVEIISPSGLFPTPVINDVGYHFVSSVTISNGGSGYGPSVAIGVTGGSVLQSAAISPILTSGVITGTTITAGGVYTSATPPTLTVTDTATNAQATATLMAIGVQGNAVTTYQGHVWVFKGTLKQWSAPGSVSDFATADGGGSETSSSNTQRVGYINAVSTNGFLFEISDSSMDYVSGVQTTGTPPTTTFTENNSDPEVGTPYPAAITTLGTEIFLANATGIFVSSGGSFQKISAPMDGVYNTVPASSFNENPFNGFQLSAAKATIFGKRVWMALVPIVDPVSGSQVNKLLLVRDKQIWFASQQDVALTFIQTQEINSIYTAWGTDGTNLFRLFDQPSAAFTKLAQSKYWDDPGYENNNVVSRFWSLWDCLNTTSTGITLTVDTVGIDPTGAQYTNAKSYSITGPSSTGYFVTPPEAVAGAGVLRGMTLSTNAEDMALISAKLSAEQPIEYRG